MKKPRLITAEDFLRHARLILREREKTHGDFEATQERIASFWNAYLASRNGGAGHRLRGRDVGTMMVLLKLARVVDKEDNLDSILDVIGYAAGVGKIAVAERK